MKLHLPLFLRKAILTLMLAYGVPAVQAADLTLGAGDSLSLDFADASTIQNLDNGTLQLSGGTLLELLNCGSGDGKTYTLATGVSSLRDAEGNALTLDSSNNAISNYFDTTRPGTGFWADAILQLTADGILQLERHQETVEFPITITNKQTGKTEYNYYAKITSEDISLSTFGGAIEGDVNISNNGSVSFCRNSAYVGGAIHGNTIVLNGNARLTFRENYNDNTSSSSRGGAISGVNISINNNDVVEFVKNSTFSRYNGGGAVYSDYGTIAINGNNTVIFDNNSTSIYSSVGSGSTCGGAISSYGTIQLIGNGNIVFINNQATSDSNSFGGAVSSGDYIVIADNGSVSFENNRAVYTKEERIGAYGGAIYANGNLSIQNNDSVLFEKNAEISAGTYRLRSIHAGGVISLSVAAGKSIEFRDAVYIGSGSTVNLNADYTDAEGNHIKQQGDIIFTGATTVDDLYEVKGNVAGTEEEIRLSCTTEVNTMTNLYGGRLRVEDGAIYQGQGVMVHEGSEATVLVRNATLNHEGFALTFNAGTTLQVQGDSLIVGDVFMLEGSALDIDGCITINGALSLGQGLILCGEMLADIQNLQAGESLTLVGGLETLTAQMAESEYTAVADGQELLAADYFSNLNPDRNLVLMYNGEIGTLSMMRVIPEPATITLSLLALAGLCARRRRE